MSTRTTRAAARAVNTENGDNGKPKPNGKQGNGRSNKTGTKATAKAGAKQNTGANPTEANTSRKRKQPAVKNEDDEDEDEAKSKALIYPSKRARSSKTKSKVKGPSESDLAGGAKMASAWVETRDAQRAEAASPAKNAKVNPYNLTPGQSPYPDYPRPTPSECQHVADVLSAVHGKHAAPKTVPVPSLNSSGCGEVPSVLDALIRTRLSAATNNANSSRAFRGLVQHFGIIKEGVGKGSVDWDRVRKADVADVFECIRSGGLAAVKSRDIKKILQMVWEENQRRRAELQKSSSKHEDGEIKDEEQTEVEKARANVLSLDHLHALDSNEAFNKLVQYPGIGPKTASCVLLFCMQRPSFAVDTHVFRLTRWLGWTPSEAELRRMAKTPQSKAAVQPKTENTDDSERVDGVPETEAEAKTPSRKTPTKRPRGPPPVTRNSTYSHLDVRIPDELKYPLHYLLIRHGKTCPSCMAKRDGAAKAAWGSKQCPLKGLKTGEKVGKGSGAGKKRDGKKVELEEEVEEWEEDDDEEDQDMKEEDEEEEEEE